MPNRPAVLVVIDDAPHMEALVTYAASIASRHEAELQAVQVVSRAGGLWAAPHHELRLRERLRVLRPAIERAGITSFRVVTLRGALDRAVAAYAHLQPVRLIVVGPHHGSSGWWRPAARTRSLARLAPVPTLFVAADTLEGASSAWTRIVTAVDFTPASRFALRTAAGLARERSATLTMFHAMASPRELVFSGGEALRMLDWLNAETQVTTERLQQMAADVGATRVEPVVLTGDPHRGLLRTAQDTGADLIVLGTSPRSWFDELTARSTLRAVLRRAQVPVLVVPGQASGDTLRSGDDHVDVRRDRLARVLPMRRRAA